MIPTTRLVCSRWVCTGNRKFEAWDGPCGKGERETDRDRETETERQRDRGTDRAAKVSQELHSEVAEDRQP